MSSSTTTRSWLAALCLLAAGCPTSGSAFECGQKRTGSETIYHCSEPGERCICRTGGCAVPDEACVSKYAYREDPFGAGDENDAGIRCVDLADLDWSLTPTLEPRLCPLVPWDAAPPDAAPPDAEVDAEVTP
jgi:hypothetical protein